MVNYIEFLGATMNLKSYLTKEKLDNLYEIFDPDGVGKISK